MKEPDFSSTVSAAKRGDRRALTALHAMYHPMLVRYIRPQVPGFEEQLADQTWFAVGAELPAFAGDERDFRVLLLAEACRQVSRHRRRSRGRQVWPHPPSPQVIDLRSAPAEDEPVADASISGLLPGLSPHQTRILLLRVVGGLTVEETAGLLQEKPATIRLTEYEALQQIAHRLETEQKVLDHQP